MFSVLGGFTLGIQPLLDPARHRVAQLPAVVLGDPRRPQDLKLVDQLGGGADVLALQLAFHEVPHVFDGIQIRTVPRPVNDLKWLISKEIPDPLGGMAGSSVLQEVGGSKVVHPEQQVVLENLLIPFAVHGGIFWQKVNATSSLGTKAPPYHN
jgi:hypothetical protein